MTEGAGREAWTEKQLTRVDLAGGSRTQLTGGQTAAMTPAWSPDGQRLAYVSMPDIGHVGGGPPAKAGLMQRRIWLMNRDGSNPHPLTDDPRYRDEWPHWSADGQQVVFVRLDANDQPSLWIVPASGGEPRVVVDKLPPLDPQTGWFCYYGLCDWGGYVDVWTAASAPTQPTATPTATVAQAMPTPTPVISQMQVQKQTYTSPDARWTAQVTVALPLAAGIPTGGDFYQQMTVSRAGGSLRWIVVDEWSRWLPGNTTPQPVHWSVDGQFLYYTNRPEPDGCALFVNGSDLWRVNLSNGLREEIVPAAGLWLSLSPDEKLLAYLGKRGLVLRDMSTGTERELTLDYGSAQAGNIVWAPDASALALTVAHQPCTGMSTGSRSVYAASTSLIRVDVVALRATVLIREDERLFITVQWLSANQVSLQDKEGQRWWMDPATGQVVRAASTAVPTSPPTNYPYSREFPLNVGNNWVYRVTRYEGFNEANDVMTATFTLTDTIASIEGKSGFVVAAVQSEHSAEALVAVRGSYPVTNSLQPAHTETYWLIVDGNRLIRQDRLNLADLSAGGGLVELSFPVQLGSRWSMYYPPDSPVNRQVTQQGSLTVPAGTFTDCFYLQGQIGGTTFDDWFCPGIGFVWDNAEHQGTPLGARRELIGYIVHP